MLNGFFRLLKAVVLDECVLLVGLTLEFLRDLVLCGTCERHGRKSTQKVAPLLSADMLHILRHVGFFRENFLGPR